MNFRFKSNTGKGVQCSSDPEFAFSNVPQNGKIKFLFLETGKFERALCVRYQRIIFQLRKFLKS